MLLLQLLSQPLGVLSVSALSIGVTEMSSHHASGHGVLRREALTQLQHLLPNLMLCELGLALPHCNAQFP